MLKMLINKKKILIVILLIIVFVIGLALNENNEKFLILDLKDYLSLLLDLLMLITVIYVSYYLTERNEDFRAVREKINSELIFISSSLNELDDKYFCDEFESSTFTLLKKKIDRSIIILENYSKTYGYEKNSEIIKNSFEDIQNLVSNHITNPREIRSILCDIYLKVDKIDSECNKIFLCIFKCK